MVYALTGNPSSLRHGEIPLPELQFLPARMSTFSTNTIRLSFLPNITHKDVPGQEVHELWDSDRYVISQSNVPKDVLLVKMLTNSDVKKKFIKRVRESLQDGSPSLWIVADMKLNRSDEAQTARNGSLAWTPTTTPFELVHEVLRDHWHRVERLFYKDEMQEFPEWTQRILEIISQRSPALQMLFIELANYGGSRLAIVPHRRPRLAGLPSRLLLPSQWTTNLADFSLSKRDIDSATMSLTDVLTRLAKLRMLQKFSLRYDLSQEDVTDVPSFTLPMLMILELISNITAVTAICAKIEDIRDVAFINVSATLTTEVEFSNIASLCESLFPSRSPTEKPAVEASGPKNDDDGLKLEAELRQDGCKFATLPLPVDKKNRAKSSSPKRSILSLSWEESATDALFTPYKYLYEYEFRMAHTYVRLIIPGFKTIPGRDLDLFFTACLHKVKVLEIDRRSLFSIFLTDDYEHIKKPLREYLPAKRSPYFLNMGIINFRYEPDRQIVKHKSGKWEAWVPLLLAEFLQLRRFHDPFDRTSEVATDLTVIKGKSHKGLEELRKALNAEQGLKGLKISWLEQAGKSPEKYTYMQIEVGKDTFRPEPIIYDWNTPWNEDFPFRVRCG